MVDASCPRFTDRMKNRASRSSQPLRWGMLAALALGCGSACVSADSVDVREQPLEWISPGTVIGRTAPQGWTHLLYAAYPRIGAGDVDEVSGIVKNIAKKFTVSCVANVVGTGPDGKAPYQLEDVRIGLGTIIRGQNTIISSDQPMGARLGIIDRQVLQQCESDFQTGVIQIARTPTMCVYDCKAVLRIEQCHRDAFLRYVVLVSPDTGQLGTLTWMFDSNYELKGSTMQYLPASFQEDRVMSVDADRFFLGMPQKHALAQVGIAQGTPIEFSPTLRAAASHRRFTPETAERLEAELWKLWSDGK